MTEVDDQIVGALVEKLLESCQAQPPAGFPTDEHVASLPGLYSWWADETARSVIGDQLSQPIPPLVYAGQAGATRWPSGMKSKATLASRIRNQHINGNASSSTFRLTMSALLLHQMKLTVLKPGRLEPTDRKIVSIWIKDHLRVLIVPYGDRDSLGEVEDRVLEMLDPPLNLDGRPTTDDRVLLKELRAQIMHS